MNKDLIFGLHSIYHCLKNPKREGKSLVGTSEGIAEFKKKYPDIHKELESLEVELLSAHELQEKAKKICQKLDVHFQRVPSQLFLMASEKEIAEPSWLYENIISGGIQRIICLDQVTDIHNAAAIVRTAAFFNVQALVFSTKGTFGKGPSFYRIASGGSEHLAFVKCKNLSKLLGKLQDMGVGCLGFSEHSKGSFQLWDSASSKCLIFGAEETGMSHAVERVLERVTALKPQGAISSLNVSVAAAVAMEKFFSN